MNLHTMLASMMQRKSDNKAVRWMKRNPKIGTIATTGHTVKGTRNIVPLYRRDHINKGFTGAQIREMNRKNGVGSSKVRKARQNGTA